MSLQFAQSNPTLRHFQPIFFFLAILLLVLPMAVSAAVIHVPADQPTIQAGLDAAEYGDTVLLAAGTYTWTSEGTGAIPEMISIPTGVNLGSADGYAASVIIDAQQQGRVIGSGLGGGNIENLTITGGSSVEGGGIKLGLFSMTISGCVITGNSATGTGTGGGICLFGGAGATISDCVITGNTATGEGGGIYLISVNDMTITGCTLSHNAAAAGGGLYNQASTVIITNTIIAFSTLGEAIGNLHVNWTPALDCCDLYGNAGGDWVGDIAPYFGVPSNQSADPIFCYAPSGDFFLHEDSPCLPENNPFPCGQIGALGLGCDGTIDCLVEPTELVFDYEFQGLPIENTFSITHTGNWGTLSGAISEESTEFSVSPESYDLGPGEQAEVTVTFLPDDINNDTVTIDMGTGCEDVICTTVYHPPFTDIDAGLESVYFGSVAWGDYDNDGDLDVLLTGSSSAGKISRIYRNNNLAPNMVPNAPTGLGVTLNPDGSAELNWTASTDAETPQPGLTYNLRVGTTSGGTEICSPLAQGSGLRTVAQLGGLQHNTSWSLDLPPGIYYWSVQAVDNTLAGSAFAAEEILSLTSDLPDMVPTQFALHAATPNPFNPMTTISYDLPQSAGVTLAVYNIAGRRVRTLVDGEVEQTGRHSVAWNGMDERGRQVPSGVYFYRLEAGSFEQTKSMTLIK